MGSASRWIFFLTLFFLIYGSMHLYLLVKVRRAFYIAGWNYLLLLTVLLFLMVAPVHARLLHSQGYEVFALIISWFGYLWMGYLFLFVCLAVPLDAYHLAVAALQQVFNADLTHLMLSRRHNCLLVALAAGGLVLYGAVAAYQVSIKQITLPTTKIPDTATPVRLVYIADLHLGPMTYPGRTGLLMNTLRQAQPDILISTGELVDGPLRDAAGIAGQFKSVQAPLGKYAVPGNREFHQDLDGVLQFTQAAGFTVLRNAAARVNENIMVAGVDDRAGAPPTGSAEARLLADLPEHVFTILIKHRPELEPTEGRRFDLQLSGHTRIAFGVPARAFRPLSAGWYQVGPEHHLHISRGTGTWGPPIRVFARPEITIIDLIPKGKPPSD